MPQRRTSWWQDGEWRDEDACPLTAKEVHEENQEADTFWSLVDHNGDRMVRRKGARKQGFIGFIRLGSRET